MTTTKIKRYTMNVYMVTMKFAVQTEHTAAELLAMDPYQIEQESMSVPDVQVTEMVEKADACNASESARDVRDALTLIDDGSAHDAAEDMVIQLLERAAERLETRSPVGVQS